MKTSLFLMMRRSMKKQAKKQTNKETIKQTNKQLKKLVSQVVLCARENRHPLLQNKEHTVMKYIEHTSFALICLVFTTTSLFLAGYISIAKRIYFWLY